MQLRTWMDRYLFKSVPSVLLGIHPEMEFLGPRVILCLTVSGIAVSFFF